MSNVLVVCAIEEEARHVEALLAPRSQLLATSHVSRHVRGTLKQSTRTTVDIVVCGIGTIDAAMVTTLLLAAPDLRPMCVLSVGCAGAHDRKLRSGDVVICTAVVPTACRMQRSSGLFEHVGFRTTTQQTARAELPADEKLLRLARSAAARLELPWWPGADRAPLICEGKVGSSDTWVQHVPEIERLHSTLSTLCEEMESAAVARVCDRFSVPFVAIKEIVNNELLPPSPTAAVESGLGESLNLDQVGLRAAHLAAAVMLELELDLGPALDVATRATKPRKPHANVGAQYFVPCGRLASHTALRCGHSKRSELHGIC
jgi:5'-methylthioadenosine/S-adenosylhomocysteine nucleosidase